MSVSGISEFVPVSGTLSRAVVYFNRAPVSRLNFLPDVSRLIFLFLLWESCSLHSKSSLFSKGKSKNSRKTFLPTFFIKSSSRIMIFTVSIERAPFFTQTNLYLTFSKWSFHPSHNFDNECCPTVYYCFRVTSMLTTCENT